MSNLKNKQCYLDYAGLLSIGLISLGYVLFIKGLAEQHIYFPFLNFPIFTGEIVFFICAILFIAKYGMSPAKFTKWNSIILVYFIFVLMKSLYGYCHFGPLAFRHAALFYYPAFAAFGYVFFRRDHFGQRQCLFLLLLIFVALIAKHSEYATLTLVLLGVILVNFRFRGFMRHVIFLAFFAIIPYKDFFQTARMMIVSNFVSGLYLAGILPAILKIERRFKPVLTILIGGVVIAGFIKFTDHGALKSIIAFEKMAEVMKSCDMYINANIGHYKMVERKEVKLYNPDKIVKNSTQEQGSKQAIVDYNEVKITDFALEHPDEKAQKMFAQEMKQEVKTILDMQLPKENSKTRQSLSEQVTKDMGRIPTHAPEGHDLQAVGEWDLGRRPSVQGVAAPNNKGATDFSPWGSTEKQLNVIIVDDIKEEIQKAFSQEIQQKALSMTAKKNPTGWVDNNNAVFRILIWRDMLANLAKEKPIFGFDFGDPLRSKSLEMLNWGASEWARDGWVEPHNSYLHIIYRAGLIGIFLIFIILAVLFKMIKEFIRLKSFTGICLCGIIINWFVAANFLVIFEVPYTAIPIWTIYGMTLAYYHQIQGKNNSALSHVSKPKDL